jgi:predicted metal-dependent hydrolase
MNRLDPRASTTICGRASHRSALRQGRAATSFGFSTRRKWGSCSTKGIVTLAADPDEQTAEFQYYVIVHELLHLKVKNHFVRFPAEPVPSSRPTVRHR